MHRLVKTTSSCNKLGSFVVGLQQQQQQQQQHQQQTSNASNEGVEYREVIVTIRMSEHGFGFELNNGILIVKVLPSQSLKF